MKTTDKDNPTGVTIMWDKPRDQVINQLTHYHVTYEVTKEAGYPVVNSSKVSVNVSAESKELSLDGFNTYSTFKIKVEAVSSDGKLQNNKILFAVFNLSRSATIHKTLNLSKTCRCPSLMSATFIPSAPYSIKAKSNSKPRGIIPEILARMVRNSCGTCRGYKTWDISYTINATKSITEPDIRNKVDFRFPVRMAVGKTKYRGIHTYVPLITVPGVALMTRKKTPSAYARDLGRSLFGCWPIFAVSFAMAILAGIVIWFVESRDNYKQFDLYFHNGIVEGIWWSLITMTTVGYGDRYPKTVIGRSIAIFWFLTGIVLSSLLVSSLTSSMSVRILDQHLHVARGKKVGSLAQFPEYEILLRYIATSGGNTFPSLEGLVEALRLGEVDGILVDLYTAHYRSDLFTTSWIQVSQILPYEFTSGVVIEGNAGKLERHFREYVRNDTTVVTSILQKTTQENNEVTTKRKFETEQIPLLNPRTQVYRMALLILFCLLCLAVIVGLVYHSWYQKLQKRRYDLQAIRGRERKDYIKARQELQQMVEEFYQRFTITYKQMRLRHQKQLERLKMTETKSLVTEKANRKVPSNLVKGTWV